jgi:hypothetical protein
MNISEADYKKFKQYVDDIENEKVPLTKPKKVVESVTITQPVITPELSTIIEEPTIIKKPRAPKTVKQMESFKKLQAKRKEILDSKRLDKKIEASKLLLQHDIKPVRQIKEESDDEPDIIYVKKPKKKKQIVIEESDSDEESVEKVQVSKPANWGKSQKNKKSVVKVDYQQPVNNTIKPSYNFFCD